jgi:5'-3' exoribonuclease 1
MDSIFDSNCITPGTEFMAALSEHLRYFVRMKLKLDASWQRCQVIFSGHEVPGEGEHKIMHYIRCMKMQPDYNPNLRHCLYGLDADLIMLALVSHDPHFALLREEVVFGGGGNSKGGPGGAAKKMLVKMDAFQLLHISILRQYFDLEFRELDLPFGYSLERVIDDLVFMCFFVGNDFVPHMPALDIAEGGLDNMLAQYKKALPTLGGYVTEYGHVDMRRLEVMTRTLAQFEATIFAKRENEENGGGHGGHGGRRGGRRNETDDALTMIDASLAEAAARAAAMASSAAGADAEDAAVEAALDAQLAAMQLGGDLGAPETYQARVQMRCNNSINHVYIFNHACIFIETK